MHRRAEFCVHAHARACVLIASTTRSPLDAEKNLPVMPEAVKLFMISQCDPFWSDSVFYSMRRDFVVGC